MTGFSHCIEAASTAASEDRAVVVVREDRVVIALADGAGGTGYGECAAQAVIDAAGDEVDPLALLERVDEALIVAGRGQTTAVVLVLTASEVVGASAGDSRAWLLRGSEIIDLTERQVRKPLLGAGAVPVAFRAAMQPRDRILLGSDGLFNYTSARDIVRVATQTQLAVAARELVELVRLPNGGLQDDVTVVLCELA